METLIIEGKPLYLKAGRVRLTEVQAKVRAHCLTPVKDKVGVYDIIGPVCFKAGEEIGYEAPDIPSAPTPKILEKTKRAKRIKKNSKKEKSQVESSKLKA